jgi:hypothetical protein
MRRLARLFRWTPTVRRQRLKAVRALNRPQWAVARYLLRKARKTPAAALKRLSAVRWAGRMFGRPPGEEELWRLVATRIRSQTASNPTHKARPLPPTLLRRLIDEVRHAAPQAAATLALAWITSGRIDDLCRLGPRNMSKVDDWLVFDFRITKADKIAAPREDHCSAVQTHLVPQWLLHEATSWKQPDAKLKQPTQKAPARSVALHERGRDMPPELLSPQHQDGSHARPATSRGPGRYPEQPHISRAQTQASNVHPRADNGGLRVEPLARGTGDRHHEDHSASRRGTIPTATASARPVPGGRVLPTDPTPPAIAGPTTEIDVPPQVVEALRQASHLHAHDPDCATHASYRVGRRPPRSRVATAKKQRPCPDT